MRISDWISDVCSSDVVAFFAAFLTAFFRVAFLATFFLVAFLAVFFTALFFAVDLRAFLAAVLFAGAFFLAAARFLRSEEHTSELQSLMRISYAVFCLKKKTKTNIHTPCIMRI